VFLVLYCPTVTLNFDLLTAKLKTFIFVPYCLVDENLSNTFQDIVFTMFRDARTHGRTHERNKTIMRPTLYRAEAQKSVFKQLATVTVGRTDRMAMNCRTVRSSTLTTAANQAAASRYNETVNLFCYIPAPQRANKR